jgi:hypothetical protein
MKFKRRHGEFKQGCVISESYTATNALPPTNHLSRRYSQLIANRCCRLACSLLETPFVTRDFFFGKFVREPIFRDERRS